CWLLGWLLRRLLRWAQHRCRCWGFRFAGRRSTVARPSASPAPAGAGRRLALGRCRARGLWLSDLELGGLGLEGLGFSGLRGLAASGSASAAASPPPPAAWGGDLRCLGLSCSFQRGSRLDGSAAGFACRAPGLAVSYRSRLPA